MSKHPRLNILLLANKSPWPPRDGGSFATLAMARGLSRAGANVMVLAMSTSKHRVMQEDIPHKISQEFEIRLVRVNATLNLLKAALDVFTPGAPYIARRFLNRNFRQTLQHLLTTRSFDLVQLEGLYMTSYISDVRERSKCRIVLRPHNLEHEIWGDLAGNESNPLRKLYFKYLSARIRKFERKAINSYDLIVPITQRDEEAFRQLGNSKPSHCCPSGLFAEELPEKDSNRSCDHIFYLGALDWRPNQEGLQWFISHVWTGLKKKHPGLIFRVAGRNAPGWLISKILDQDILFAGEVDDSAEFMNRGGIMVVPLLSGSGLRIRIVEALALGIPVAATPVAARGLDDSLLDHLAIALTPRQFADEISGLLEDPETCMKLGEHARKAIIRDFDNFVMTRALLDFYKNHQ